MTLLDDRHAPGPSATPATGRHRVAGVLAVTVAVVLLATAIGLQLWLPDVTVAQHWSLAWTGLDVATAATALATAVLLHTGDPRAALTASAGAALLVLDAWFDVCTSSPGPAHIVAVTEALVVELPLATVAIGLAVRLLDPTAAAPTTQPRRRVPARLRHAAWARPSTSDELIFRSTSGTDATIPSSRSCGRSPCSMPVAAVPAGYTPSPRR